MGTSRNRLRLPGIAVSAALVTLLLSGCMNEKAANFRVCDAFAFHVNEAGAVKAMDRLKVIEAMSSVEDGSDLGKDVAVSVAHLKNARLRSAEQWLEAAVSLAESCRAAGYEPSSN